jgi:hypothetical protein
VTKIGELWEAQPALPSRTVRTLQWHGITTHDGLMAASFEELRGIDGIGRNSLKVLDAYRMAHGASTMIPRYFDPAEPGSLRFVHERLAALCMSATMLRCEARELLAEVEVLRSKDEPDWRDGQTLRMREVEAEREFERKADEQFLSECSVSMDGLMRLPEAN